MNCVVCEKCEVASDYPACSTCAKVKHFEHVRGGCRHCAGMTEAELQAEPMLRLVTPTYVAEIESAYSDDARLQADMLGELTTEIVIQQTERGYKFQLPEYQAPSPEVVKALRGQCCISYQSGQAAGNPVRTFPANQLDYVKGFLAYWFSEQDPRGEKGKNRNGSKIISVRVVAPMAEQERLAA